MSDTSSSPSPKSLLNRLPTWPINAVTRVWRQRSWNEISREEYAEVFAQFGGSIHVHPRVVDVVAMLSKRPIDYRGFEQDGRIIAAVPVLDGHIIATKRALEKLGYECYIDVGETEVVLPIAPGATVNVPFKADFLSPLQAGQITNAVEETSFRLAIARSHGEDEPRLKGKFKSENRRKLRQVGESGGSYKSLRELAPADTARIYCELFRKRWNFAPQGEPHLPEVLHALHDLLNGFVLFHGDKPIGIQIVYRAETPTHLLGAGINSGMDPEFSWYSPGSLLYFLNTQTLYDEGVKLNKPARYGFGRFDEDYKKLWCYEAPAYRID